MRQKLVGLVERSVGWLDEDSYRLRSDRMGWENEIGDH